MPLPVIATCARVAFTWSDSAYSRKSVNVMHFDDTATSPAALAAAIDSHVTANMWIFQNNTTKCISLDVTPLDGTGVTYHFNTGGPSKWTGVQTGGSSFPQAANIVKLLTNTRGRSYRGRVFLPWVSEDKATNGLLDATTLATCQTAWNAFLAAMVSQPNALLVASYKHATATAVTSVTAEQLMGTQRRRQPRPT
jgi:hypothetical protein